MTMTTCPNNKRGCRVIRHPDDENYWFCPTCKRKFVEDPGFPLILLIVGMIIAMAMVFLWILPSNSSLEEPGQKQRQPAQLPQSRSENSFFSPDQSID